MDVQERLGARGIDSERWPARDVALGRDAAESLGRGAASADGVPPADRQQPAAYQWVRRDADRRASGLAGGLPGDAKACPARGPPALALPRVLPEHCPAAVRLPRQDPARQAAQQPARRVQRLERVVRQA